MNALLGEALGAALGVGPGTCRGGHDETLKCLEGHTPMHVGACCIGTY